jgi:NMDA receptor-regulated protein 1
VTLRAYSDVLKFEDNLWGEEYYFEAARATIRIYLHLHDNPQTTEEDDEPDYSKMTAAERKKAKAIARKKRVQAEKKEAQKQKSESQAADNGGIKDGKSSPQKKSGKVSPIDEDPEGKELLKKDPLEEAEKYSIILSKHCPQREETWACQYDIGTRRKKPLVALQALFKLQKLDTVSGCCPSFLPRLVDFSLKLPSLDMAGVIKDIVTEQFTNLLNGKSVEDIVKETASQARADEKTPLSLRVAIAKALISANTEPVVSASSIVVDGGIKSRGVTVESCRQALEALKGFGKDASDATKQWKATVTTHFPMIKDFD